MKIHFALIALILCGALAAQVAAQPSPPQKSPTACTITLFSPAGKVEQSKLRGTPGLVLSGGGFTGAPSTQSILPWIRTHLKGTGRQGNLVVLKASGGRDYSAEFYAKSQLASIQEILIPPCALRAEVERAVPAIDRADAVLFAGGDQANYVIWKGTKLVDAVKRVYARGGIVGGGSAGLAIQGDVIFDSVTDDKYSPDTDVATADAVKNPYERIISFTTGFFSWPAMHKSITDTHFARRNRFGRSAAFMARVLNNNLIPGDRIYGVAVDEGEALLVDNRGVATLVRRDRESDGYVPKGAYFLEGTRPFAMVAGKPLRYTLHVTHIWKAGQQYDLTRHRGQGRQYDVTVDGSKSPMYSRDPYQ